MFLPVLVGTLGEVCEIDSFTFRGPRTTSLANVLSNISLNCYLGGGINVLDDTHHDPRCRPVLLLLVKGDDILED
jgi:hypothetical protein